MRPLPYPSLRVFETVARLHSFSRAAEDLGMTQSAVSQHVRALEDWTGCQLIARGARRSIATPEGARLAEAVAEGLGRIDATLEALQATRRRTVVNIACPPGFAVNWLFPRLLNFDSEHPDIPVSISTRTGTDPGDGEGADAAIRYAAARPRGMHAERLFGERVFPVCTPDLGRRLKSVADLGRHTLLVDTHDPGPHRPPTWESWAEETGQTLPAARTRRFGQSNLSIQAAIEGAGVALGRLPLVIDALASGRLVRPFPQEGSSRFHYWFTCPPAALEQPHLRDFRDWLRREAATLDDRPAQGN
jgi:LysR family glycine cleavage system transcriptional activator